MRLAAVAGVTGGAWRRRRWLQWKRPPAAAAAAVGPEAAAARGAATGDSKCSGTQSAEVEWGLVATSSSRAEMHTAHAQ